MNTTTLHRQIPRVCAAVLLLTASGLPANEPGRFGPAQSSPSDTQPPLVTATAANSPKHTNSTTTWTPYPLFAGEMTSIASHPTAPDIAWVGTRDAGVFKTVDGGQSWSPSRTGLTFYPIRSLVVDPVLPSRIYAGTDFNGVWKSNDGGASWFKSSVGVDDLFVIFNTAIDPSNTDIVYATGFGGIAQTIGAVYRSADAGATWMRADSGIEPTGETWVNGIQALAIDPDVPTTLYAGTTYEGIFRTTNSGASWTAINGGVPWLAEPDWRDSIDALAVDHHHGGRPSAVISTLDYFVLDPFDVWQLLSHDFLAGSRMAFHPTVSDTVMMAGGSYVWSTDGGLTWSDSGPGTVDFALDATEPDTILGARDVGFSEPGGVYRSTDAGVTWSWASDGITAVAVRSVAADPNDSDRLYAGTGDGFLYRSIDGGVTWTRAVDADYPTSFKFGFEVKDVAAHPQDSSRVFLASNYLFRSLDGGASFADVPSVPSATTIVIAPDGSAIYVGCSFGNGIFKSTDGGDTWVPVNNGLPTFGDDITPILSLAIDPSDHQTVWAGTQFGGGVVKSTDGGLNWQVMGLTDNNLVPAIAVNPYNGADILAGAGFVDGGLYRSTNGGLTWTAMVEGVALAYDIVYDPLYPGHVYAATEGQAILRSVDGGASWTDSSDGIFYPLVYSLDITPNRRLLTGSYGSGLYWLPLPPDPAVVVFADGFESGDSSAWSGAAQ